MSNEMEKQVTVWYKKRLTPEEEEMQKNAEEAACRVFKTVNWDPEQQKTLFKNVVDYIQRPNFQKGVMILGEALSVATNMYFAEKYRQKKLPNIAIIGDFWELAPIETLLIWEGYDKDGETGWNFDWNADIINDSYRKGVDLPVKMIVADSKRKTVMYHNHSVINHSLHPFKASEPEKILQYIHDFNK